MEDLIRWGILGGVLAVGAYLAHLLYDNFKLWLLLRETRGRWDEDSGGILFSRNMIVSPQDGDRAEDADRAEQTTFLSKAQEEINALHSRGRLSSGSKYVIHGGPEQIAGLPNDVDPPPPPPQNRPDPMESKRGEGPTFTIRNLDRESKVAPVMLSELELIRKFNTEGSWTEQVGLAVMVGGGMLLLDTLTTAPVDFIRAFAMAAVTAGGGAALLTGRRLRRKSIEVLDIIMRECAAEPPEDLVLVKRKRLT